ncbi:alpha/beta-hydrolase [Macroventuria anomochaeta]|uniref:Alpha/beta-hydrolase n=1 Tax=Macroventuria anomochaeta TaxID=301207 RepID=A0ACB6S2P4_9PLEO|nr:alpha/beta-hydrolase [Macroventuria anomochaeta]KAF2628308.1 alpha/beta-hydrolase [Macroventuria anomochaeta]
MHMNTSPGARRWLPSAPAVRQDKGVIDATQFGPACPQLESNRSTLWSVDAPQFGIMPHDYVGEDYHFRVEVHRFHTKIQADGWKELEDTLWSESKWIRDNIVSFGGDASRIKLWGHSAGAVSVDSYSFAYPVDPIVAALIMSSGTAHSSIPFESPDLTVVAENFGCQDTNAAAEVDCLRNVKFTDITAFLQARSENGTSPPLPFAPIVNNRTVFSNHTARALSGDFIRRPAMIGTTVNEFAAFLPYNRSFGPDQGVADNGTLSVFLCPSVFTTHDRYAGGHATTFRYLYGGNFSNIAPRWWEGAYHQADMPLVFRTHGIARSESTSGGSSMLIGWENEVA